MKLETKIKRFQINEQVRYKGNQIFLLREIIIDTGKSRKELINQKGLRVEETMFNGDYFKYRRENNQLCIEGYNAKENKTYTQRKPIEKEERKYVWGLENEF